MVKEFLTCNKRHIFTLGTHRRDHYPATSVSIGFFALLPFVSHLSLWPLFPFFQELLFSSLDHLQAFHKPDGVLERWQSQYSGEAVPEILRFCASLGLLCLLDNSTASPVVCSNPLIWLWCFSSIDWGWMSSDEIYIQLTITFDNCYSSAVNLQIIMAIIGRGYVMKYHAFVFQN